MSTVISTEIFAKLACFLGMEGPWWDCWLEVKSWQYYFSFEGLHFQQLRVFHPVPWVVLMSEIVGTTPQNCRCRSNFKRRRLQATVPLNWSCQAFSCRSSSGNALSHTRLHKNHKSSIHLHQHRPESVMAGPGDVPSRGRARTQSAHMNTQRG